MVRARQQREFPAPRNLAVGRGEDLVEARAGVQLEIGHGGRLQRGHQFESAAARLLGRAHAQAATAARARQGIQEAVVGLAADRDGEKTCARSGQAAPQGRLQALAADLSRGGEAISDIDHGGLLGAVQASQRHVEQRA
jgi:hypothetical protein